MDTNRFYQEGQLAQENGLTQADNPYDQEVYEYAYDCWNNGFNSHSMPSKSQLISDFND